MSSKKHYLAGITAFVIWGFFPLPLRALSAFTSGQILYFRILFSLLVLALVVFGFRKAVIREQIKKFKSLSSKESRSVILLTLGGALLLTVNWLTFIYIVNNVNVRTASFAYLICPVITAILGYLLISEKMTTLQWVAVALCAFSCALVGISSMRELGFSFFTALTYALYLITQRKNQGFDRIIVLGIQVLFSFVLLSFGVGFLVNEIPAVPEFYFYILIIAVMFTVLPLFLNLFALNKINSATIGILMYLNPLINFTLAFAIYKESINSVQLIGYSIILVGLVLFNYPNIKKLQTAVGSR